MREQILETLFENGEIQYCSQYGEQGYNLEENKKLILFANWNDFDKHPNFMQWLEENYECEWSDEWIIDYENDKCYRTVANSYGWQQQWRFHDCGELLTPDSDISDWLEYVENDPKRVLPSFLEVDLEELGYELINDDLQSGWYGRHDSPEEILEELESQGYTSVVFQLACVSQFAVDFEVYAKK